jgi:hypothetical protein
MRPWLQSTAVQQFAFGMQRRPHRFVAPLHFFFPLRPFFLAAVLATPV